MKSPFLLLSMLSPVLALKPSEVSGPSTVDGSTRLANDLFEKMAFRSKHPDKKRANNKLSRNLQSNVEHINFTELLNPDYTNENDEFLEMLSAGLIGAKNWIHSSNADGTLGMNDVIGGLVDDDGFIEFEKRGGWWLDLGGSAVNLTHVGVKGFDTFLTADMLRPTTATDERELYELPDTVIQNSFSLETLILDLYLDEFNGGEKPDKIRVRLPFSGVDVTRMPLALALSEEGLKNLPVGSALNFTKLMPCLKLSVFDGTGIEALEATFEQVLPPAMIETTSPDSPSPFLNVLTGLFIGIPASVPIFFNTTIRNVLSDMLTDMRYLHEVYDPCPSYPGMNSEDKGLIDFNSFFEEGLPAMLINLLEDQLEVDPDTGLPKVNNLINSLMEGMGDEKNNTVNDDQIGSSMVFGSGEEGLLSANGNIAIGGLDADLELHVRDLTVYNLDTMIPPLELLKSLSERPHQLNNTMTMGLDLEDNPERSMGLSAEVYLSILTNDKGNIGHNMRLQTDMEAVSIGLLALLEIAESRLNGFPVKDLLNLQCWLATLHAPNLNDSTGIRLESEAFTVGISKLMASLAQMNINVSCLGIDSETPECESPGIEEWTSILATPESQAAATEWINSVLAYVASLLSDGGGILQTPIDRILNEASLQCPHSPFYDSEAVLPISYDGIEELPEVDYSNEYLILWGSIALALVVTIVALAFGVRSSVRRKHRRWLASSTISSQQKNHLLKQQQEEADLEESLNAATKSMFCSSEIPALVRWGMPPIILGNIALFLSGHLNLGANVFIELKLMGEVVTVDNFFDLAIARTTIDVWESGGYTLAILMMVFSMIWPYTKQLITLTLWFLPPSKLSISTRGTYFIWLDKLAKWSMIDIFIIVICVAGFRVSVKSPEFDFLTENFYSFDILVVPMWGLYSNMTAQLVSQVSSHYIIYYQRRIVKKATETLKKDPESEQECERAQPQASESKPEAGSHQEKIILKAHSFSDPYLASNEKLTIKNWVGYAIIVLSVCMSVLLIVGSFIPSFSIEILGIIGVAVESGQNFEDAITRHSLSSIVGMLFDEARFVDQTGDYIGIGVLGCLVFATVMVVPILQVLGLIYQWFVPLTQNGRRRLSVVNEVLAAWQYVEVYLIALFIGSWQLGPVSQYMFNEYCGALDGFLAQMVNYGILEEIDAQCYGIQGSIEPGSIALLVAAIVLALVNSVVTLANNQCLKDYGLSAQDQRLESSEPIKSNTAAKDPTDVKEGSQTSGSSKPPSNEETTETSAIRPFPFVFTDVYRWLLTATISN